MNQEQLIRILEWAWIAFGFYWLIAALRVKAARTTESPAYRAFRLVLLAITFTLLFAKWAAWGFFGRAVLPSAHLLEYLGLVLALAGMALAVWARVSLGQYWSDKIVLKADHQLIRSGPYGRMRHPIYSGVLLGVAGSAFVVDEWRGVLAFFLLLTNYIVKAKREDKLMAEAFPIDFAEHQKTAGFLLPRLAAKE